MPTDNMLGSFPSKLETLSKEGPLFFLFQVKFRGDKTRAVMSDVLDMLYP